MGCCVCIHIHTHICISSTCWHGPSRLIGDGDLRGKNRDCGTVTRRVSTVNMHACVNMYYGCVRMPMCRARLFIEPFELLICIYVHV
jgi:hypothetical protein